MTQSIVYNVSLPRQWRDEKHTMMLHLWPTLHPSTHILDGGDHPNLKATALEGFQPLLWSKPYGLIRAEVDRQLAAGAGISALGSLGKLKPWMDGR